MKKTILFFLMLIFAINLLLINNNASAINIQENVVYLKEIVITPISIIDSKSKNFLYEINNERCVKIFELTLESENIKKTILKEKNYLIENNNYIFYIDDYFHDLSNSNLIVNYKLNVSNYFKFGDFQNEIITKNEPINLSINKKINDNEKNFEITFNNINLSSGGISFKLIFVFEVL